jgi:hypothetical protein
MEVSYQLHTPAARPQGNSPWYSLDRRLGGAQIRSGRGGEGQNSQSVPRFEPPIIQPVGQLCNIELLRILERLVLEVDRSYPTSAEVKNAWSYTSTLSVYLHGVIFS